ncbi:translesion error-prone DNA polymerase V autoproteolytic subunit [Acidovorax sp. sif1233]|uniref:LexA family protein n=1 Tax=Acidovorax sp. sif1233 TaxID=2854792 RepID=UPI001C44BC74|nr:translesion error-prone DNA polymerase V autoproteolytic subunit [Acidovorax sp. sif1233]MBV7454314.1 translesion error-prone DNA polymerase V autoproteolytic subunit [Acidovorax sp. sif1233]
MNSISLPDHPVPAASFPLALPLANGRVCAGFPSPAEDFGATRLDLTAKLIKHPQATYIMGVSGFSMKDAGIDDGDLIVIDRAVKPANGQIVLAIVDGEFTVKYLSLRAGRVRLKAANPTFPDIVPRDGQTIEVWGVVTSCVKLFVH